MLAQSIKRHQSISFHWKHRPIARRLGCHLNDHTIYVCAVFARSVQCSSECRLCDSNAKDARHRQQWRERNKPADDRRKKWNEKEMAKEKERNEKRSLVQWMKNTKAAPQPEQQRTADDWEECDEKTEKVVHRMFFVWCVPTKPSIERHGISVAFNHLTNADVVCEKYPIEFNYKRILYEPVRLCVCIVWMFIDWCK